MSQHRALRLACLALALLTLTIFAPTSATAQAVPTFEEAAGHAFGDRITWHHEMVRYVTAVAEQSERATLVWQGETWEGRKLPLLIVTSEENHARLSEIQEAAQRLGDPRSLSAAEAEALIADQPVIVWMGGSIHGNELSGTEGLLKLAEHLTTRSDEATLAALANTVVLIDPILNPDGRDAFVHENQRRGGVTPNPKRDDWGNSYTGWEALGYRTGHYFFDTNRDWFAHTQAETRARFATLRDWRPQVVIDAHEMGSDVEFYFDPPAPPFGPYFPEFAKRGFELFGNAYAAAFDQAGFEYMTRERFNFFYPGYTTSWGSYQGAVGMLYEQASSRGLAIERAEDWVRTLGDALEQQYTAAWTAVRTSSDQRQELLTEYVDAHRAAIEDGRTGIRRYLITAEGDPALMWELGELLLRNGIDVGVLTAETTLAGVRDREGNQVGRSTFSAGTLVVEAAQPRNRLVRALLEPDLPIDPAFLAEARERVENAQNPRFYDITAWSLPLLFNVGGYSTDDDAKLSVEEWVGGERATAEPGGPAPYAYLLDGTTGGSMAALHELRRAGHKLSVLLEPTRVAGQDIASGTVIVRIGQNDDSIHAAVAEAAERHSVAVTTVASGLAEGDRPSLGSGRTIPIDPAEVAIVSGQPVHAYSFGWAWYVLDRQYGIPTTVLHARSLDSTPLDRFDVIVLPDLFSAGGFAREIGQGGIDRLSRWVRDGGTLVALANSAELVRNQMELASVRSFYPDPPGEGQEADPADQPQRFSVPGALLRVELDPDSWLSAGYSAGADGVIELPTLVTSSRIFLAPEGPPNPGRTVAGRFAGEETLRISGQLWEESRERLADAVFAYDERVGRGRVVLFSEDLNFRAYWRGSDRLFLNAVVLGPSAP